MSWPVARALLIAATLGVGLLDGCPAHPLAGRAGDDRAIAALLAVRAGILAIVRPLAELAQIRQRWNLFPGAEDQPLRITVEARGGRGAPWNLVYRPHDPTHAFLAEAIEYRRVRGAWNPSRTDPSWRGYRPFVTFLARRILARRPEVDEVRVRMERLDLLPEGGGLVPTGQFRFEQIRRRSDLERRAAERPEP